MKKYLEDEIIAKLKDLNGWTFSDNAIEKKFLFKDFKAAMAFIIRLAEVAETKDHHPEIYNVYNKVRLRLNTHDAGGVTDKDFELASAIELLSN